MKDNEIFPHQNLLTFSAHNCYLLQSNMSLRNILCVVVIYVSQCVRYAYCSENVHVVVDSKKNKVRKNLRNNEVNEYTVDNKFVRKQNQRQTVVGGQVAMEERYSYVATIKNKKGKHICGGTLIAPDIVLTAAHCKKANTVVIGDHHLFDSSGSEEIFLVKQSFPHPEFRSKGVDAMILVLDRPSSHSIIKLNSISTTPAAGVDLTVMGWGAIDKYGTVMPNNLHEVTITSMENEECQNRYGSRKVITEEMTCTEDVDGISDSDACDGDSGGPLILKGSNISTDVQVGIVAFGSSLCGHPGIPGGYIRTSSIQEWIRSQVCFGSVNPPEDFNCPKMPILLQLDIQFDHYSNEVSWELEKDNGDYEKIVKDFWSYPMAQYSRKSVSHNIRLDKEGTYQFTIKDMYGDGICCNYGNGYYMLTVKSIGNSDSPDVSIRVQDFSSTSQIQLQARS